jgi:hypothetical protein
VKFFNTAILNPFEYFYIYIALFYTYHESGRRVGFNLVAWDSAVLAWDEESPRHHQSSRFGSPSAIRRTV